ncbi:MAG: sigma-70 family RNA polymerase sigma factor [Chloroflexi bacterium]|nr:sigma-70 family RNA polymerase sigma factor [Chloroflexota bacterium]
MRVPPGGSTDPSDRSAVAEETLVEHARRGDVEAYGELVSRYQALAQRTAYVILRDADAAQDAAQEAFVKAFRAFGRFRTGAPVRPWLLRIVANEAINRAKAGSRHPQVDLTLAESEVGDPAASPEAQALASERRESLVRALNEMREDDRIVIAYRYFFELSEAEMADALGIARGTVKSRLSRAMTRLREQLRD